MIIRRMHQRPSRGSKTSTGWSACELSGISGRDSRCAITVAFKESLRVSLVRYYESNCVVMIAHVDDLFFDGCANRVQGCESWFLVMPLNENAQALDRRQGLEKRRTWDDDLFPLKMDKDCMETHTCSVRTDREKNEHTQTREFFTCHIHNSHKRFQHATPEHI